MHGYSDSHTVEALITKLSTKDAQQRKKTSDAISRHLESAARELSIDAFTAFENALYQRLFGLVHSPETYDKMGGVQAIDALIDCTSAAAETKVIKFANILSTTLKSNTDYELMELVAAALGHMARATTVTNVDYLEFELNRALEGLRADSSQRRLAACLLLKQVAENAPTIFFVRTKEFFEEIWTPLRDPKQRIRVSAADALSAALQLIENRKTTMHQLQWYYTIYDQIHVGLGSGSVEAIHGSLLVIQQALKHTGDFMTPRFEEICRAVMLLQDNKSKLIRVAMVELLPELAQFCPDPFARSYLEQSVTFLVRIAKSPELRPAAFTSLGKLARAVRQYMVPYLDKLLELVHGALVTKRSKEPLIPEVLQCIADMVVGLRVAMRDHILNLLDPMFAGGLNSTLIDTVTVIARHIPEHKRTIQRRLLEEVSLVLGSQGFEAPSKNPRIGFGLSRQRHSTGSLQGAAASGLMSPRSKKSRQDGSELVLLSLRTLGGLNMQECLLPFVQEVVLGYLDSPHVEIRAQAAATCCLLLLPKDQPISSRGPSAVLLEEILQRLLQVAVGDLEPTVREAVLTGLDPRFDRFLCQMHHVTTLLFLLGDENFTIRVKTIALLGRLARMNPAAVLPPLRQHLLNLISGLTYGYDARFTEECIMLLCHFLDETALQRIVRPFMSTIVHSLPLKDDVRLATAGLEAMGALCTVMRQDMMSYIDTLIPVIIENIHDTSSTKKQEVSIRTLGQLVGATGYVVTPYMQYPNLLPRALELLIKSPATTPWSLRCETLRTIGILGALDPYKFHQLLEHLNRAKQQQEGQEASHHFIPLGLNAFIPGVGIASSVGSLHTLAKRLTFTDGEQTNTRSNHQGHTGAMHTQRPLESELTTVSPLLEDDPATVPAHRVMYEQAVMVAIPMPSSVEAPRISPANPDYYPRVAIRALMKILRDPSLSTHHNAVTQAIMHIFTSLGMRSVPYLDDIIPYMLQVVRQCTAGLRESLLQQLSSLAIILRHHLAPFLPGIFDVVVEFWYDNLDQVCSLVEQIALASRDEVLPYIPRFLPLLLGNLSPPKHLAHDGAFVRTVACIEVLSPVLTSHVHLLVPALCTLMGQLSEMGQDAHQWRLQTLQAIESVVNSGGLLQCPQMASRVVHTVLSLLDSYPPPNGSGLTSIPDSIASASERIVCELLIQVGARYVTFEARVLQQFRRVGLQTEQLNDTLKHLHSSFTKSTTGPRMLVQRPVHHKSRHMSERMYAIAAHKAAMMTPSQGVVKLPLMQQSLQRSWDVTQRSTAEDWNEWMRRFCVDLLKESPSPALRSCSGLAQAYIPLAKELFHAAFVSCWYELSEAYQENLVRSLELAFRSSTIPPEILQTLLNLAEFMEHDVSALPIDIRVLADLAQKCHAYAKALHYKELEFQTNPSQCVEALISINKKLDMHDAAIGILKYAQKMQISSAITIKESWLAKLGDWEEALDRYRERAEEFPTEAWPLVGQMKCLEALGQWEEAVDICTSNWQLMQRSEDKQHSKAAVIAARAAWALNDWKTMGDYAAYLGDDDIDGSFYRAVLAVHQESYELASQHINTARRHLDKSLTALLSESYNRAYASLVMVQQLSELEEIVHMKRLSKDRSRDPESTERQRRILLDKWRKRLQGCKTAVPVWLSVLTLRRMLISSKEDYDTWLEFEALCRHSGNVSLAKKVLETAQSDTKAPGGFLDLSADLKRPSFAAYSPSPGPDSRPMLSPRSAGGVSIGGMASAAAPGVLAAPDGLAAAAIDARFAYAHQRQEWYVGRRKEAIHALERLLESIPPNDTQLRVRCLLKLGQWKLAVAGPGENIDLKTRDEVLQLYHRATVLDPNSYRAWHEFALTNYRASQELRGNLHGKQQRGFPVASSQHTTQHLKPLLVNATQGLLRAIALGTKSWSATVQQDMLCLLTLWFRYGHLPEVYRVLSAGLSHIHVDTWLGVLPQLIARIHSSDDQSRALLHDLLVRLGARHVQALVYPMSVAVKSPLSERKQAAERIMTALRQHSNQLIDQALLVSQELIRVAILWYEQWHEGLEEASRLYFAEGNIQGMLDTLFPLHEELERGPTTLRESNFADAYANDLQEAHDNLKTYLESVRASRREVPTSRAAPGAKSRKRLVTDEEDQLLQRAWHLYYLVFKRINKQLPHHMTLELEYVSPALQVSRDLDLAVPGTYRVSGQAVRIRSFGEVVHVISSKQRPRKLTMCGEDGESYMFLLKGHEDLRQDERAMQLFGLVNALLERDRVTANYDLSIRRYAVVPLSPNTGLVGWVPQCDTLHTLIRDYRDKRNVVLNIEHRLMSQMYQDYDSLTLMQKLEAFEYALDNTDGQDLYKVLWLKSDTSEVWLQRRANYTRSLAVMSMVGYILGLGDRHPSNLMLDRSTGKIVHIDFGDCFEVAMQRERFPEKVPFRLTRMLVRAMEVSGIEGNYRLTCERVMAVLRDNRQSLLAMLEAFVHDPLISWRLLHPKKAEQADTENSPPAQGMAPITEEPAADQSIEEGDDEEDEDEINDEPGPLREAKTADTSTSDLTLGAESTTDRDRRDSGEDTSDSETEQERADGGESVSSESDSEMDATRQPTEPAAAVAASRPRRRSVASSRMSYYGPQMHAKMMDMAASIQETRYEGSVASSRLDHRSTRERIMVQAMGMEGAEAPQEELTEKAVAVIRRVQDKLTGMDFAEQEPLAVQEQVELLIQQATDNENLCQSFVGWCPFW